MTVIEACSHIRIAPEWCGIIAREFGIADASLRAHRDEAADGAAPGDEVRTR
jgi:hypothetical protein